MKKEHGGKRVWWLSIHSDSKGKAYVGGIYLSKQSAVKANLRSAGIGVVATLSNVNIILKNRTPNVLK